MCSYSKIHEWQTRLALIKPNTDASACLELSLVVVDLVDLNTGAILNHDTVVTYDALSYAWGTAAPSVECICDGSMILLRQNLDSALKYLRLPQDERYVWIDFLCINQVDLVEKAVQIPRMRNIYSKASTVIIWLGKSLAIESTVRGCEKNCWPNREILACSSHREELWRAILDFTWFRRTWVRQEVFAAQILNICSPYFFTTWEHFAENLRTTRTLNRTFSHEAVRNLLSLNQSYSSRGSMLLDLLKQGKGFQASVSHDHVFSVLGMMSKPKHGTIESIPVTYDKTYDEICGDVTRFIIREFRSISILKSCPLQRNRSYAFNWPTVEMSCPIWGEVIPETREDEDGEFIKWFDIENPIKEVGTSIPLKDTTSSLTSGQSFPARPLVLFGREWGTLTRRLEADGSKPAQYKDLAEHGTDEDLEPAPDSHENVYNYRKFVIFKQGLMSSKFGYPSILEESEGIVLCWCRGSVREGDIFVSLEPGPENVLLRKRCRLGDLFEVVGWGEKWQQKTVSSSSLENAKTETGYYLAGVERDLVTPCGERPKHVPGPRKRFHIR